MVERGVTRDEAVKAVDTTKHLNGFKRDERGLYWDGRCLKAAIKESANIRWPKDRWGPSNKGTMGSFAEHVFVPEQRLHIGVTEPTRIEQHFPHTWRGTGIEYVEVVEDAVIDFTVQTDFDFSEKQWALLWLTVEQQGIGAKRSQGYGRCEMTRWERVTRRGKRAA
jgi:hypothetical protein